MCSGVFRENFDPDQSLGILKHIKPIMKSRDQ